MSNKQQQQQQQQQKYPNVEIVQTQKREQPLHHIDPSMHSSSYHHHKEDKGHPPATINIENLKLPPGITITKVDAPPKPMPIKTTPLNQLPKPANTSPKQTTIIAAPMSGVPSTNYGSSQGAGNVIVVDTGRLKQDLMPKSVDKGECVVYLMSTTLAFAIYTQFYRSLATKTATLYIPYN